MFNIINKNSKYNFLGKKKIALLFSSFLIIVSLLSFASKGLNWGIDFSSGYIIQLKFSDDIEIKDVRSKFIEHGVKDSVIQYFGSNKEVIIKLKEDIEFNKESVNEFLIKSLKTDNDFQIHGAVESPQPNLGEIQSHHRTKSDTSNIRYSCQPKCQLRNHRSGNSVKYLYCVRSRLATTYPVSVFGIRSFRLAGAERSRYHKFSHQSALFFLSSFDGFPPIGNAR